MALVLRDIFIFFVKYGLIGITCLFFLTGMIMFSTGITTIAKFPNMDELLSGFEGLVFPIFLIVLGLLTMIVSVLGCVGAFMKNTNTLITFTILIFIIAFAELLTGGYIVAKNFKLTEMIETFLYKKFEFLSKNEKLVNEWDSFQSTFECCGVKYASDYKAYSMDIPIVCCKTTQGGKNCAKNSSNVNQQGCFSFILDFLDSYYNVIQWVVVCAGGIKLLCGAMASVLVVNNFSPL